jgi:chromate transporter
MLATGITMLLSTLFGFTNIAGSFNVDYRAIAIFVILIVTALLSKKLIKKKPSPIMMIIISAGLGMLFYSI